MLYVIKQQLKQAKCDIITNKTCEISDIVKSSIVKVVKSG